MANMQMTVAALLVGLTGAGGEDVAPLGIMVHGHRVPAVLLPVLQAQGSDMDAFALWAGRRLHEFALHADQEACGLICQTPTGFAIQPLTIHAHLICPVANLCPPGANPTPVTLHAHTQRASFVVNAPDLLVLAPFQHAGDRLPAGDPDKFSPEDLDGMPGYMVGRWAVWFQAGPRHIRRVGPLRDPSPLPSAPTPPR